MIRILAQKPLVSTTAAFVMGAVEHPEHKTRQIGKRKRTFISVAACRIAIKKVSKKVIFVPHQ